MPACLPPISSSWPVASILSSYTTHHTHTEYRHTFFSPCFACVPDTTLPPGFSQSAESSSLSSPHNQHITPATRPTQLSKMSIRSNQYVQPSYNNPTIQPTNQPTPCSIPCLNDSKKKKKQEKEKKAPLASHLIHDLLKRNRNHNVRTKIKRRGIPIDRVYSATTRPPARSPANPPV